MKNYGNSVTNAPATNNGRPQPALRAATNGAPGQDRALHWVTIPDSGPPASTLEGVPATEALEPPYQRTSMDAGAT